MGQIGDRLRLSLESVQIVVSKANELGLDWEAIEEMDEQQLASAIYPEPGSSEACAVSRFFL